MSNAGQMLNQAYEILKRTYREIYRLKEDATQLLEEMGTSYQFAEEYSYGPKRLYIKPFHTFVFRAVSDVEDGEDLDDSVFAIVVIFGEEGKMGRIMVKDEPEIWFVKLETFNSGLIRPWQINEMFTLGDRKYFTEGLTIGKVCPYHYEILVNEGNDSDENNQGIEDSVSHEGYEDSEYREDDMDDKDDEDAEPIWDATVIGFPLVDITDSNVLKEKVIEPLFTYSNAEVD